MYICVDMALAIKNKARVIIERYAVSFKTNPMPADVRHRGVY